MAKELEPTAVQLERLAQIPGDQPVAMINLLQFNQPDGLSITSAMPARSCLTWREPAPLRSTPPSSRLHAVMSPRLIALLEALLLSRKAEA